MLLPDLRHKEWAKKLKFVTKAKATRSLRKYDYQSKISKCWFPPQNGTQPQSKPKWVLLWIFEFYSQFLHEKSCWIWNSSVYYPAEIETPNDSKSTGLSKIKFYVACNREEVMVRFFWKLHIGLFHTKWCKIFEALTWPISEFDKNFPSCYNI